MNLEGVSINIYVGDHLLSVKPVILMTKYSRWTIFYSFISPYLIKGGKKVITKSVDVKKHVLIYCVI